MRRFLFVALFATRAFAHDFWIEPSTFRPAPKEPFTAALRVGEDFTGEPVPRQASLIQKFIVRDADGERPVNGFENQDPAGFVRIDKPGSVVIGYLSNPYPHEISRETFQQFLSEEGVTGIVPRQGTQREHFQRFAKSIVRVGNARTVDSPLGFPFELVLDGDNVQVLYDKKPLANAFVGAVSREGASVSARSDENGRAMLKLGSGVWLIKSVHVVPAPKGANYDWDSLWASITMEK